jgi:hypothetical protein
MKGVQGWLRLAVANRDFQATGRLAIEQVVIDGPNAFPRIDAVEGPDGCAAFLDVVPDDLENRRRYVALRMVTPGGAPVLGLQKAPQRTVVLADATVPVVMRRHTPQAVTLIDDTAPEEAPAEPPADTAWGPSQLCRKPLPMEAAPRHPRAVRPQVDLMQGMLHATQQQPSFLTDDDLHISALKRPYSDPEILPFATLPPPGASGTMRLFLIDVTEVTSKHTKSDWPTGRRLVGQERDGATGAICAWQESAVQAVMALKPGETYLFKNFDFRAPMGGTPPHVRSVVNFLYTAKVVRVKDGPRDVNW